MGKVMSLTPDCDKVIRAGSEAQSRVDGSRLCEHSLLTFERCSIENVGCMRGGRSGTAKDRDRDQRRSTHRVSKMLLAGLVHVCVCGLVWVGGWPDPPT